MRWWAQLRAWAGGYFWQPCPICGRMFGGHEWRDRGGHRSSIPTWTRPGVAKGICPRCTLNGVGDALHAVEGAPWLIPDTLENMVLTYYLGQYGVVQVGSK